MFNFERYQVYEDPGGTPYRGNRNLAAVPRSVRMMGAIFAPGWSNWVEDPWKIRGHIRNGIISIDFPDIDFEKINTADLYPIDGVYVLNFRIELDVWPGSRIRLHNNPRRNERSEVLILYASADLDKMTRQGRLVLRTGWNFLSMTENADWLPGSAMSSEVIRRTTQSINDFKRQGYRWHIEIFVGGN